MINFQTVPFPILTGDAETDIRNLHEYVYKMQENLQFVLQNLSLKNVSRGALGECVMQKLGDGVYIGTRFSRSAPGEGSYGIIVYADKAPVKVINGEYESF